MITLAEMTSIAIEIRPAEIILIVSGVILTLCILGFLIFVFTRKDDRGGTDELDHADSRSNDDQSRPAE